MSKRIVLSTVCLSAALTLAACGSDTVDGGSTQAPSSQAPTSSAPVTSEAPSSSAVTSSAASSSAAPSAAKGKPVSVNKTITDQFLGHKITVLQYIDNAYQPTAAEVAKYPVLEDEKVVLVQVKATAGTKYYGGVQDGDFRQLKSASGGYDGSTNSILDDSITKAGYSLLDDVNSGKTGTGWLVFTPQKTYTKLTFAYKRLNYSTSDGKTIKEQIYPVVLN